MQLVRFRLGIGAILLPFVVAMPTGYVLAANCGSQLAAVVAGVVWPFSPPIAGDDVAKLIADEVATPAVQVHDAEDDDDAPTLTDNPKSNKRRMRATKDGHASSSQLPSIHINSDAVLKIANSGRRPTGKPVTADGERPAGVQVFGADSLGVGVRDGDVITRVSGVAVTSVGQVISLVIAARGARQRIISAQVFRGKRSYVLTVEQPYLPQAEPPAIPDAGVGSSDGVSAALEQGSPTTPAIVREFG
jgi:hypothetical protein